MNKKNSIILGLVLIFCLTAMGYSAEEYEFLRKWNPDNSSPRGLTVDKDGNLYAAADRRVLKYSPSGTLLLEIMNLPNPETPAAADSRRTQSDISRKALSWSGTGAVTERIKSLPLQGQICTGCQQ